MKCRATGVTYKKRRQLLQFIASRKHEDLTVYLQRDRTDTFDKFAVVVEAGISNAGYATLDICQRDCHRALPK